MLFMENNSLQINEKKVNTGKNIKIFLKYHATYHNLSSSGSFNKSRIKKSSPFLLRI